jgi:hypothetical protein
LGQGGLALHALRRFHFLINPALLSFDSPKLGNQTWRFCSILSESRKAFLRSPFLGNSNFALAQKGELKKREYQNKTPFRVKNAEGLHFKSHPLGCAGLTHPTTFQMLNGYPKIGHPSNAKFLSNGKFLPKA